MKTLFILAGLIVYSQGSDMQSLEGAVTEAAATSGTRSNSWLSSWWSKAPANTESTVAVTQEKTEISSSQPANLDTRATSSWVAYNPLSYFWSATAKSEEEKSDNDKKVVIRHEIDDSCLDRKQSLEALSTFFSARGNLKISPNAERIIRVRSMISSARSSTEQRFDSFAEQAAFRARMMMGERLNEADLVAEHRIAQVSQNSMSEELLVAKKKQKRKNKIEAFQQAMQADKKGKAMADLQNALRQRRIICDTEYSTEGSKALPAPEKVAEKPRPITKVVTEKGKTPTPPPMKKGGPVPKSVKRKSGPTKKVTKAEGSSAEMMDELKSKLKGRKKGTNKSRK